MKMHWLIVALPGLSTCLQAQTLSGISTRWSDSFVEWDLFVFAPPDTTQTSEDIDSTEVKEDMFGELKLRWLNMRDDWTEWDYTMGDETGTIKMKWKGDPSHWELRSFGGSVITMRTAWKNDFTQWRVTDNSISLTLKSRWTGQFDEWLVQDKTRGSFYLYTLVQNDPRDWAIEDDLDTSVSNTMKMALIFLSIFHASPKM